MGKVLSLKQHKIDNVNKTLESFMKFVSEENGKKLRAKMVETRNGYEVRIYGVKKTPLIYRPTKEALAQYGLSADEAEQ